MTEAEIYDRLTGIFRDVFDNPAINVSPATTAKDIKGWDSLGNIRMIMAVEKALGLRFKNSEVTSQPDLGSFVQLIRSKLQ